MPKKKAVWTVMVYLAGDNNLTTECLFALTEMKKARPGKHLNVIAQFDPRDEFIPTHRYEINKNGGSSTLFDDIIDEARYNPQTHEVQFKYESNRAKLLASERSRRAQQVTRLVANSDDLSTLAFVEEDTTNDTDTGVPSTLYNFLSFCIEEYPADHYLVVLSGHAGGVEADYLLKDESSKGSLTFNELKYVFKELRKDLEGQPVDIVGMDNCLMSMTEICYELRGLVDIVVGCESFSPASGWPYRQILERIGSDLVDEKTKLGKVKVAKSIVEEYVDYYSSYWMAGMSVTQSALDVRRVDELRRQINMLANVMEEELRHEGARGTFKDNLVLAHWETQSYNGERFIDLFDFCSCLENRSPPAAVRKECRNTRRFISEEFVLKSCFSGAAYQYSYGVSLYFPWAQVLPKYQNLEFVQGEFGWLSFLRTYIQLTRRLPRSGSLNRFALIEHHGTDVKLRMQDDRMQDDRMQDDRMQDDRMQDDRMQDDRMQDDRMQDDRMQDDRMPDDRMQDDRMSINGGTRISSMRNPPVRFLPDACIRNGESTLRAINLLCGSRRVAN